MIMIALQRNLIEFSILNLQPVPLLNFKGLYIIHSPTPEGALHLRKWKALLLCLGLVEVRELLGLHTTPSSLLLWQQFSAFEGTMYTCAFQETRCLVDEVESVRLHEDSKDLQQLILKWRPQASTRTLKNLPASFVLTSSISISLFRRSWNEQLFLRSQRRMQKVPCKKPEFPQFCKRPWLSQEHWRSWFSCCPIVVASSQTTTG